MLHPNRSAGDKLVGEATTNKGRACHARRSGMGYQTVFIGRNKRVPPRHGRDNRVPPRNGPDKRVPPYGPQMSQS
jgi:hypothetical protein